MSDPFVAEIRMFPGNFAPRGWAFCNGQIMAISQNTALFSLLGTMYGGNGQSNFALPNLQGSAPLHFGQGPGLSDYWQGEPGGTETVTLLQSEIPAHSHAAQCDSSGGNATVPTANGAWSTVPRGHPPAYAAASNLAAMSPQALGPAGSGQPHNNMSPYLTVNFIIALQGVFPPRS